MTDEQNDRIDATNASETATGGPSTGGASDTNVGASSRATGEATAFDPDAAANADVIEEAAASSAADQSYQPTGDAASAGDNAPEQGFQRAAAAGPGESVNDGDREAVGPTGGTSGTPFTRAAGAVGKVVDQARNAVTGGTGGEATSGAGAGAGWVDKLKDQYRQRPGVVIGAGAAALFVLAALTRRRR